MRWNWGRTKSFIYCQSKHPSSEVELQTHEYILISHSLTCCDILLKTTLFKYIYYPCENSKKPVLSTLNMSTWGRGKITHHGLAAANKSEVNHKWNALCTLQMWQTRGYGSLCS